MNPILFGDGYSGFIYFIQINNIGPIKIGYSTNYNKRLIELQVGCPYKINLLYATPAQKEDEQTLHNLLKRYHPDVCLNGEWYHPAKVILDTIEDYKIWDKR